MSKSGYRNDRFPRLMLVTLLALLVVGQASQGLSAEPLRFSVAEGKVTNEFFREGPVAAHLVLKSGPAPRLVIAFPAGNSGAALWFEGLSKDVEWLPVVSLFSARRDVPGGQLRGVTAELDVTGAPIRIVHAITSGVRVIRDYGYTGKTPSAVSVLPVISGRTVVWQRRRLDGAPGYYLSVELLTGSIAGGDTSPIDLIPDQDARLRLRVTALTGDTPLVPINSNELLTEAAKPDTRLRNILAFLSYDSKLLAGSWRFNTYFGRDTLMSLQLLMPVLQPEPVEAGLAAVLERLSPEAKWPMKKT